MPITEGLENLRKLETVGFNHEQAEALADIIEKSHVDAQENLKEFIRNELANQIRDLEIRLLTSQKDLLIKIFGIIVGTVGIAVTILKLFP